MQDKTELLLSFLVSLTLAEFCEVLYFFGNITTLQIYLQAS